MLKDSSIEIIKKYFHKEGEIEFMKARCIDFVDRLNSTFTDEDTVESKSLLIDISLAALKKEIYNQFTEASKELVEDVYNTLHEVCMNELVNE